MVKGPNRFGIINRRKPNHQKQARLPRRYKCIIYNRFAAKLGDGEDCHIKVDPHPINPIATVTIGRITMSTPPDEVSKYTIEIKVDDGSIFIEGKIIRWQTIQSKNNMYSIRMRSNQPPKTWLSR